MPINFGIYSSDYLFMPLGYGSTYYSGGTVKSSAGDLVAIFVSNSGPATGSIAVFDSATTSSGTILNTFGATNNALFTFGQPIRFNNGLYIQRSAGSANITVFFT